MCTPGVLLTPSSVMKIVREVEEWWGEVGEGALAGWLFILNSKQEEIRQKFTDNMEQKKQAISHWIDTDPLASWRRLTWALDQMGQSRLADSIRTNTEPLTGTHKMYITSILHIYNMPGCMKCY